MDRQQQLETIYEYLRSNGFVHTKKDLADAIDINYTSLCSAFSGKRGLLTDNLFTKIGLTFSDIFEPSWIRTGQGEMIRKNNSILAASRSQEVQLTKDSEIAALRAENEALRGEIKWLRSIVEGKLK